MSTLGHCLHRRSAVESKDLIGSYKSMSNLPSSPDSMFSLRVQTTGLMARLLERQFLSGEFDTNVF